MIYRSLFLQSFGLYTEILQNHLLTHANFTVIVLKMPIKYLYLTMDFHGTQKTCIHSLLYILTGIGVLKQLWYILCSI